jgi:hypothetical protein
VVGRGGAGSWWLCLSGRGVRRWRVVAVWWSCPPPFPSDSWWCCGRSQSSSLVELGVLQEGGVFWLMPAVGGWRVSSAGSDGWLCGAPPYRFPSDLGGSRSSDLRLRV